MKNLTLKQNEVLKFIEGYIRKNSIPPSYSEIARRLGLSGKSSVQGHIEALIAKGFLSKDHGLAVHKDGNMIPLLGKVAAGKPLDHKKHDERIEVPTSMLKSGGKYFALQVVGDSMIEEGILEDDIVIIQEQKNAENNQIVVAEIDDEATIKRFVKKKTHIELHSANPKYKPIIIEENKQLSIAGIFRGLIRQR